MSDSVLVLGAGFSGIHIAQRFAEDGASVTATRRSWPSADAANFNFSALDFDTDSDAAKLPGTVTDQVTHLVISIAPDREAPLNEPVLTYLSRHDYRSIFPKLQWIGYLSTIGVYGDHDGKWVDEATPCISEQPRSIMRREAEIAWQQFACESNVPLTVFRLSGIYGPGRNAVRDAQQGRKHMIIKENQVFNRIHVSDIATATLLAAQQRFDGVLNISDDEPAAPQDVIRYAHELVNKEPPPAIKFADADLSPMARSFYSENKRVSNKQSKELLGMVYRYPEYRSGLSSIIQV